MSISVFVVLDWRQYFQESYKHTHNVSRNLCEKMNQLQRNQQFSKIAGTPKSEASEIMFWTSEAILVLVRLD